ncbi:hypothetical protein ACHAXS_013170 [Conticribra weissflogii]
MTEAASETSSLPFRASTSASSSTPFLAFPMPPPKPLRATVANPYKRGPSTVVEVNGNDSNDNGKDARRRFVERSRGLARQIQRNFDEHNSRSGILDPQPLSARPTSAMHILRQNRNRQMDECVQSGEKGENVSEKFRGDLRRLENGFLRPRPRLFLFERYTDREDGYNGTTLSSRSQRRSSERDGVWMLDTGITELSGEGGSGKTQTCLSLCVNCASTPLPNIPPSIIKNDQESKCNKHSEGVFSNPPPPSHFTAIYVSMGEGIPSTKIANRLNQMIQSRHWRELNSSSNFSLSRSNCDELQGDGINRGNKEILSRINLVNLHNEEDFLLFVEDKLPSVLKRQYYSLLQHQYQHQHRQQERNQQPIRQQCIPPYQVGILIFDGIAGLFRFSDLLCQEGHYSSSTNNGNSNFHVERSKMFYRISRLLRELSEKYDIPVLVTNQVTASFSMLPSYGSSDVVPALGMAWSYCVNARFILRRKEGLVLSITCPDGNDSGKAAKSKGMDAKKRKIERQIRHGVRHARVLQSVNVLKPDSFYFVIDTSAVVSMT